MDKLDYVYATKIIKNHLLKNISYRLPVLKSSLAKDVVSRIDVLNNIYKNELKWNNDKMLDFFLKEQEFYSKNHQLVDNISKKHRNIAYNYTNNKEVEATYRLKNYGKERKRAEKEIEKMFNQFTQTVKYKNILELKNKANKLYSLSSSVQVLSKYYQIDELLREVEIYFDRIEIKWDRIIQAEIDRIRGK